MKSELDMNNFFIKQTMNFTINPNYLDLFSDFYNGIKWHYRDSNWKENYSLPYDALNDFIALYHFSLNEFYLIIYLSILFTTKRYLLTMFVKKLFLIKDPKFIESIWKFYIYSFFWSYSLYLVLFKYDYFNNIYSIWDDWIIGMKVPLDIQFLYFVECGFYLHSIYATLFMDTIKKDFFVMLFHHVITLALINISYATRYHKIGVLVIFVHDITDILLEFTKCNVYLKDINKRFKCLHEFISNVSFVIFTISWFICRLYWFPLRILYASGVISAYKAFPQESYLYGMFNILLWLLFILDIYWFYFILLFLYKILSGQLNEIKDVREYEESNKQRKRKCRKDM